MKAAGSVNRDAPRNRDGVNIASNGSEIAHQAADKCNGRAVRRNARLVHLKRR